jgi:hypothetical protein
MSSTVAPDTAVVARAVRGAAQSIVNHPLVHPLKLTADGSYQQLTAAVGRRKQLKKHETGPIHLVWPINEEGSLCARSC